MLYAKAKSILDDRCLKLTSKISSTGKRADKPLAYEIASDKEWWVKGGNSKVTTERTKAYLEAYREIVGSNKIPARGVELDDGYLLLDKGVIRFALSKDLIRFDSNRLEFVYTE